MYYVFIFKYSMMSFLNKVFIIMNSGPIMFFLKSYYLKYSFLYMHRKKCMLFYIQFLFVFSNSH